LPKGILEKSIVGFKIRPAEINFKKKLSQNRSPADRAGVLRGLETRRDDSSRAVLQEMLRLYTVSGGAEMKNNVITNLRLERPHVKFKASYIETLDEMQTTSEKLLSNSPVTGFTSETQAAHD
jgi:hypothetical protein